MGKRGPSKEPTALKLVKGTDRKDRLPANEPKPRVEAPSMPSWLGREGKREWKRVMPYLLRMGLASQLDRSIIAAYCQAYHEWWEAKRQVEKAGKVWLAESGYPMKRPEVQMRDEAWHRVIKAAREIGLTPSARSSINVPPAKEKEETNPFEALTKSG